MLVVEHLWEIRLKDEDSFNPLILSEIRTEQSANSEDEIAFHERLLESCSRKMFTEVRPNVVTGTGERLMSLWRVGIPEPDTSA